MNPMNAIVQHKFGSADVLELQEVDKPVIDDDGVLVRVHAASVNPLDWHIMTGIPYFMRLVGAGLRKPKRNIPGVDFAGRVEAVGRDVTQFRPDDEVFGRSGGSLAEFVAAPEDKVVHKPANLTFEQAGAVPIAAITALQAVRDKGKLQPGQSVLINGASGGVGTFAVQIAKGLGAEVTGVCSTRNVDIVRSIGADHVIDYTQDDFAESECRYDVLVDIVGNHSPSACKRVLNREGIYVVVGGPKKNRLLGPVPHLIKVLFVFMFASPKAAPFNAQVTKDDLIVLQDLLESGKVVPVIDRCYELSEAPEAFRYLEQGHAQGKIIITL